MVRRWAIFYGMSMRFKPVIFLKCSVFLVAKLWFLVRVIASIIVSLSSMGCPSRSSSAYMRPAF